MANEIRRRSDFVAGGLSAGMLTSDTAMNSAGLADLPAIGATEHAALTLWRTDVLGRVTQKEVVYVTAHTASATTATVTRGREGTTAQAWSTGDRWSMSSISSDLTVVCTAATRPSTPYTGQVVYETDTKIASVYNGAQWDPIGGLKPYNKATALGTGSTASTSFVDVPTAIDLAFIKRATHTGLAVWGGMTHYVGATGMLTAHALLINGVDYSMGDFFFNPASQHMGVNFGAIIATGLAAGSYTARLRWRVVSGGGGASINVDPNDVTNFFLQEVLP